MSHRQIQTVSLVLHYSILFDKGSEDIDKSLPTNTFHVFLPGRRVLNENCNWAWTSYRWHHKVSCVLQIYHQLFLYNTINFEICPNCETRSLNDYLGVALQTREGHTEQLLSLYPVFIRGLCPVIVPSYLELLPGFPC